MRLTSGYADGVLLSVGKQTKSSLYCLAEYDSQLCVHGSPAIVHAIVKPVHVHANIFIQPLYVNVIHVLYIAIWSWWQRLPWGIEYIRVRNPAAYSIISQPSSIVQEGFQDTIYLLEKLVWSSPSSFVQIINVGGYHWACLSNKLSPDSNTIQLYDSLLSTPGTTIIEQACTILKCETPSFNIQVMNVQLQSSSDSCGLCAIDGTRSLCR